MAGAGGVGDLVIKMNARQRSFDLDPADPRHGQSVRFGGLPDDPGRVEDAWQEPGFDDDDATCRQVIPKAPERLPHASSVLTYPIELKRHTTAS